MDVHTIAIVVVLGFLIGIVQAWKLIGGPSIGITHEITALVRGRERVRTTRWRKTRGLSIAHVGRPLASLSLRQKWAWRVKTGAWLEGASMRGTHKSLAETVAGVAAADMDEAWEHLARPAVSPTGFDPAMTDSLPEPARRWLTHVIAPGTPLARAVTLDMRGHIRLGRWIRFRAVQVHAPPAGFIWAARARWGPVWIGGYDRYFDATGEMRWRLFGRIPVMSASGPDIDRSAAGRVALDSLLVPTAWLQKSVTWRTGDNDDTVVAEWHVDDETLPVTLTVGPDGALRSLTMPRWAQPAGHRWGEYPIGGTFADETDFDGVTLNRTIRAGYFYGTDKWDSPAGEFFRAEITQARFA